MVAMCCYLLRKFIPSKHFKSLTMFRNIFLSVLQIVYIIDFLTNFPKSVLNFQTCTRGTHSFEQRDMQPASLSCQFLVVIRRASYRTCILNCYLAYISQSVYLLQGLWSTPSCHFLLKNFLLLWSVPHQHICTHRCAHT